MEVTLTIQNETGELGHVTAAGPNYAAAHASARALIPEGCTAIAIRTDRSVA